MIPTRMYKALSELFLNSLMVAKTESMRQEKTKRKLEEIGKSTVLFSKSVTVKCVEPCFRYR